MIPMEIAILSDENDEFASASSSENDGDDEDRTRKLDLAHMIASVDPPLTPRSKALRQLRRLCPPAECNVFYTVLRTDLKVQAEVFQELDGKLLSDADIDELFVRNGSMYNLLQRGRKEESYIIALHMQREADSVGIVQVTPHVFEVLNALGIGFGMVIHFPDDSVKRVPLEWCRGFEGNDVVLRYNEEECETRLVVVSHSQDDLLRFDICFMSKDVFVENFIVMHASMTVGKFGAAVEINRGMINEALARLFRKNDNIIYDIFSAVDQDISELIGMEIEGPNLQKEDRDGLYSLSDHGEGSSASHASHYDRRVSLKMDEVMKRNAGENMHLMSPGYQTTEGWFRVTPKRNLNENIRYRAGVMSAKIRVNVDDSIYNTMRNVYSVKKEELRERSFKHVKKSQKMIIQQSYPPDHNDYMTNDETYVNSISKYKLEHAQKSFTPDAILRASYLTIYRHRCIFDAGAVPNIKIPDDLLKYFKDRATQDLLAKDRLAVDQCIADEVIDAVLEEEELTRIPRTVALKNWELKCPVDFVEDALRQMLDAEICVDTWTKYREEYKVVQKMNTARKQAESTNSIFRRLILWGAAGLCGSAK